MGQWRGSGAVNGAFVSRGPFLPGAGVGSSFFCGCSWLDGSPAEHMCGQSGLPPRLGHSSPANAEEHSA